MTSLYSSAVASHYAAYRPALHEQILDLAIPSSVDFALGLDIGCGTGVSTIALAKFCRQVIAVDPSSSMLHQAQPHPNTDYRLGSAEEIPATSDTVDIATFAGSLFYADVVYSARELTRVCRPGACIVVYDFAVRLDDILSRMGMGCPENSSVYDHRVNFSGISNFREQTVRQRSVTFEASASEIAHLVLADSRWCDVMTARYGTKNPHGQLVQSLKSMGGPFSPKAEIFYSTYEVLGSTPS